MLIAKKNSDMKNEKLQLFLVLSLFLALPSTGQSPQVCGFTQVSEFGMSNPNCTYDYRARASSYVYWNPQNGNCCSPLIVENAQVVITYTTISGYCSMGTPPPSYTYMPMSLAKQGYGCQGSGDVIE